MPEGDAIYKDAKRLGPWLEDREVTAAWCRRGHVVAGLVGTTIGTLRTHGKHLLIPFSSGVTLRVHRRMTGVWRRYEGDVPREGLGLSITTAVGTCAAFHMPVMERIDDRRLATHDVLTALGPDVLLADFDPAVPVHRGNPDQTVAEALLDQQRAAGIGNVYRAEALFIARQDPFQAVGDCPDAPRLWATASRLMKANLERPGMRTTQHPRSDHWVYGRARRPCLRCRTPVRAEKHGRFARTLYWCPRCQPSEEVHDLHDA